MENNSSFHATLQCVSVCVRVCARSAHQVFHCISHRTEWNGMEWYVIYYLLQIPLRHCARFTNEIPRNEVNIWLTRLQYSKSDLFYYFVNFEQ